MNRELEVFIKETLSQVLFGTSGYTNIGEVDFDIAVVKTIEAEGEGKGKLGISVVGYSLGHGELQLQGGIKHEHTSRIKFSVRMPNAYAKTSPMQWPPK